MEELEAKVVQYINYELDLYKSMYEYQLSSTEMNAIEKFCNWINNRGRPNPTGVRNKQLSILDLELEKVCVDCNGKGYGDKGYKPGYSGRCLTCYGNRNLLTPLGDKLVDFIRKYTPKSYE